MLPKAPDGKAAKVLAHGYDPAWSLVIDKHSYSFQSQPLGVTLEGKTPPGATRLPDGGSRYQAEQIDIELRRGPCSDAMTGERYFHNVAIYVEGKELLGCGGATLPPQDLDGTSWRGQKRVVDVLARDFDGELKFADGKISGTTGCNRFSASYRVEGEFLHVGPMAMTKMICKGLQGRFESELVELFKEPARMSYGIGGSLLLARNYELSFGFDRVEQ